MPMRITIPQVLEMFRAKEDKCGKVSTQHILMLHNAELQRLLEVTKWKINSSHFSNFPT